MKTCARIGEKLLCRKPERVRRAVKKLKTRNIKKNSWRLKIKKIAEISTQGKQLKFERNKMANEISAQAEELEQLKWQAEEIQAQINAAETAAGMDELNAAIAERDKIISATTNAQNNLARFLQNQDEAAKTQKRI